MNIIVEDDLLYYALNINELLFYMKQKVFFISE